MPRRDVRMSAHLVERDRTAYSQLAKVPQQYPDLTLRTYQGDFLAVVPDILKDIPPDAFTFFLIDPKGWRIPLRRLEPMLARRHSEVIFNFMFDFINRAASMKDPAVVGGLDELMPHGEFRGQLAQLEGCVQTALRRKNVRRCSWTRSPKISHDLGIISMWPRRPSFAHRKIGRYTVSSTRRDIRRESRSSAIAN